MEKLVELETKGWEALSSGKGIGKKYYDSVLHEEAVMMFPGGLQIIGKQNILESISSQPWKSFEIEDARVICVSGEVGILAYRVTAMREGRGLYKALISSTYIFNYNEWKLIFHQHTPE